MGERQSDRQIDKEGLKDRDNQKERERERETETERQRDRERQSLNVKPISSEDRYTFVQLYTLHGRQLVRCRGVTLAVRETR